MAHRLSVLAASFATLALACPVAYAGSGSAPVTHPDTVTLSAGEGADFDLTANDTDPDGDDLAVCRLGADVPRKLEVAVVLGRLVVLAKNGARGSYTFTYYACDQSYLTAGTVTVTVKPPRPDLKIIPVDGAPPGRIRLVNTFKNQTFHCAWHPLNSSKIEGRATVPPLSTVVIEVHEAELTLECDSPRMSVGATFGAVHAARRLPYSANASGGGQAQTRLRSP